MSDQWYYFANGKKLGPVSFRRLQQIADMGVIGNSTAVFSEEMADTVLAQDIPEIFGGSPNRADDSVRKTHEPVSPSRQQKANSPVSSKQLLWVVIGGIGLLLLVVIVGVVAIVASMNKSREQAEKVERDANEKFFAAEQERIRQDGKKRLAEIDEQMKNPPETKASKEAAKKTLECLRKLESATTAGLSFKDYQTRLLDTKVDFDIAIYKVGGRYEYDQIYKILQESMEVYLEARDYWGQCLTYDNDGQAFKTTPYVWNCTF